MEEKLAILKLSFIVGGLDFQNMFSNWKSLSNDHDMDIFFADPTCPGQPGLNEHSNGLLGDTAYPNK